MFVPFKEKPSNAGDVTIAHDLCLHRLIKLSSGKLLMVKLNAGFTAYALMVRVNVR